MIDIAAAKRRYILMGAGPEYKYRFVALIGLQCCMAAESGGLVRFNPDKGGWGSNWDDPTKFVPPETGCN